MYPRPSSVSVRLSAHQAETIYWELLGLLESYRSKDVPLEVDDEGAILSAITQLEVGIKRAEAIADVQLEQLRRSFIDAQQRHQRRAGDQEVA
jgi:hypothetical protein